MDVRTGPPDSLVANCDTLSVQPFRPRLFGAIRTHMLRNGTADARGLAGDTLLAWLESVALEQPIDIMRKVGRDSGLVG
jgi:hypothetical protein